MKEKVCGNLLIIGGAEDKKMSVLFSGTLLKKPEGQTAKSAF